MDAMKRLLAISFALAALTGAANAAVFTFNTPGGSQVGGMDVSSSVTFTTGDGTLTVDLSNTLTSLQMVSVVQNLSDLKFTLSNTDATGTVDSSSGTEVNVDKNGVGADAGTADMGWDFSNTSNTYLLECLGSPVGPSHTILGGNVGDTDYSNGNGSIAGNSPHNPFIQGLGHWVLDIDGVNSDTTVSGVVFSYGTTLGNDVPTPEPTSMAALAIGAVALIRRRRKA